MVWSPAGVVADPFDGARRYAVVYADPPWSYRDHAAAGQRGVSFKYPLLSNQDIAALPVESISADDAMLFLWVTWPKLPEVLPVIDAWGFRYRTVAFVWVKRTRASGALAWGMGNWTRANTEPCLLATRGRPKRVSAGVHQVVEASQARHSEKPAEVRERVVQLAGDVSRIELFARQVAPGWDAWGADVLAEPQLAGELPRPGPTAVDLPGRGSPEWHALRARALAKVRANGPIARGELAAALDISAGAAKMLLTSLLREGVITRQGRTRATRYRLADAEGISRADGSGLGTGKSGGPGQLALRPRDP